MRKAIHFICASANARWKNLRKNGDRTFQSGFWNLSEEEAKELVGGFLYLHETKAKSAGFGGRIVGYSVETLPVFARALRIDFRVEPMREARGTGWRGARHAMAWTGGLVPADCPHEEIAKPVS